MAGPRSVTLLDDELVELRDLGTNFYLTEAHVGNVSRSVACVDRLAELNSYVEVSAISGDFELGDYSVVVCCSNSLTLSRQIEINEYCRSKSIGFISADCFGLAGHIFVDFGDKFTCFDKDGEEVKSSIIAGITREEIAGQLSIFTHNDKRHGFHDGDYVVFREVQGMIELNDPNLHSRITVTGPYSFKIQLDPTVALSDYTREGIVTQLKKPVDLSFCSLAASQLNPDPTGEGLPVWDLGKFGRPEQLHVVFKALRAWIATHSELPRIHNAEDIGEVMSLARAIDAEIDPKIVAQVVSVARCEFGPMTAFAGGVVAQEIVKFTGKYKPLHQSLYFDMFEVAAQVPDLQPADLNSRYSDLHAILGRNNVDKLLKAKLFLVGSGALGCELLKAFALGGIGCGTGGVVVTDMDRIETSNLNRQFLFRSHHVGQQKSTTAASAARSMNPAFNCTPLEVRVGPETEDVFDDEFWDSLDCVVNALDNVQARLYVDSRCVWFNKPLLESGTLGTKANVQVVIPNITQSYGDSQDPPEESIPLCTLKNFPHQIEHTIEWARDVFHGLFTEVPGEGNTIIKGATASADSAVQIGKLKFLESLLSIDGKFEKCVEIAIGEFTAKFDHSIAQLLYTFPLDHKTTEGNLFWSGPKRPPVALQFDPSDSEHLNFVVSAANLIASMVGLPASSRDWVEKFAKNVTVAPFVAKEMKIKTDDKDTTVEGALGDEIELRQTTRKIAEIAKTKRLPFVPHEFEKDDDTNFHIDFIASAANLRARNYRIPEVDKFRVKLIAGKIIPAIATTTAMVVGLVTAELIKILTNSKPEIELFKNSFVNLALPVWILSEPSPPIKTTSKEVDPVTGGPLRAKPEGFTPWEKILVDLAPGATVGDFIKFLADSQNLEIVIVSCGNVCIYNAYLPSHKPRLAKSLVTVYEEITKATLPPSKKYLGVEVSATDIEDDVDVVIPSIKYRIRK